MDKNLDSLLNSSVSKEDVEKYFNQKLSSDVKEKIRSVLSDKQKLGEILSSDFARELMKKLRK